MKTNTTSIQKLSRNLISNLSKLKLIEFRITLQKDIESETYALIKPDILTEEDLSEIAQEQLEHRGLELQSTGLTETQQHQKIIEMLREQHGEHSINGFYFKKSLKELAGVMVQYFLSADKIEEVYGSDEELHKQIVSIIKKFQDR